MASREYDRDAVMTLVCEKIAAGESLRSALRAPNMPDPSTFLQWARENDAYSQQYTRARAEQADYYADEIVSIADTAEDANLARVQIDARKWVAARLLPKKWGDKQEIEHSGKDGTPLVPVINLVTKASENK